VSTPTPYRRDLVTALLGAWFTIGLFLDAWAHSNLTELESFFTPWHAVFYTGFFATAGWIAWIVRDALPLLAAGRLRDGFKSMPPGYAGAAIAIVGFGLAAIGDLTWHTVFGIEQEINILFSPTHLGLGVSMLVILTTPLRAAWAQIGPEAGLRRLLPAVIGLAFAAAVALLFVLYANALTIDNTFLIAGLSTVDEGITEMVAGHLAITTVILIAPLLTIARRWVPPFGTATIIYAALAGLSGAVTEFQHVTLTVAVLAAGVAVDLLALWLRPISASLVRFRAYAALAPLITWTIYIAAAHVDAPPLFRAPGDPGGPPEPIVELYTGVPIVQGLIGLLLAVLLVPAGGRPTAPEAAPAEEVVEAANR